MMIRLMMILLLTSQAAVPCFAETVLDLRDDHLGKIKFGRDFNVQGLTSVITNQGVLELGSILGQGFFGIVYCIQPDCSSVIKIPKTSQGLESLMLEQAHAQLLQKKGFLVAEIDTTRSGQGYIVKKFYQGITMADLLDQNLFTEQHEKAYAKLFVKAVRMKVGVDLKDPGNLIWDSERKSFRILDTYLPDNTLMGRTVPNIQHWRNALGSDQPRLNRFNQFISEKLGLEKILELDALYVRCGQILHGLKNFGPFD